MEIAELTFLNIKKTYNRLRKDTKRFSGFHVRDAVDFIDYNYNLDSNLNYLISTIKSENYSPSKPILLLSPKSKGINRPTVVPLLEDILVYRFCIEQIENELLNVTRQKHIRGGIKITANKNPLTNNDYYEKWFDDWKAHNENIEKSLKSKKYLVYTDIASYFDNINLNVLKDLVRSEISGKKDLLNLLFYFLESTVRRVEYQSNTFTGLLQEDFNASRVLAFYFLKPHDEQIAKFCKKTSAEYYRFVDDMSVLVNSETEGRKALKTITESLRSLNLIASLEKTAIIKSSKAKLELFFSENEILTNLEKDLIQIIKAGKSIKALQKKIGLYYSRLIKLKKNDYKNWQKILKRFYTLCSYGGFNIFGKEISNHLILFPLIFADARIKKFLLRQSNLELNKILKLIIDYLYSDENLYQQMESNLIETINSIPLERINASNKKRLNDLSINALKYPRKYQVLSEYSRALSGMLLFKLSKDIDEVVSIYLKSNIDDFTSRKYFIIISLTTDSYKKREKVLMKAKKDPNYYVQNFITLIDNADTAIKSNEIKKFFDKEDYYIYYDPKSKFSITEKYDNVRARLLKSVIEIYA